MNKLKVIGISGSLRENSFNTALLKNAKELSKEFMDIRIYDISKIPFYNHDLEKNGIPDEVEKFKSAIDESDALLFVLPEYNASVTGVIKNAIDWASRKVSPLFEKPCAIMGASGGLSGTAGAQAHFRHIAVSVNMICMNRPAIQIRKSSTIFDENLLIKDETTLEHLDKYMKAFESWILNFTNKN
ncbi:MAG TPA: NADPH-dependent FMN reductase [Ignavibacteria bacterium]|nr:NADPH-dependent FMN reductase [Ignavibacteria bacterium]HQY51926.1 NADPH-dependent FMN reductase [Ignavibacteria bacterium]HRA99316.1 NADPH-dependent FMN reductase [Ignavibacteria bacterium]